MYQEYEYEIGSEYSFKKALVAIRRYQPLEYDIERFTDRFLPGDAYNVHIEWEGEESFIAYYTHGHSCNCCSPTHSSESFNLRDVFFPVEYEAKLQKVKDKEKKAAEKLKAKNKRERDEAELQRAKATLKRLSKKGIEEGLKKAKDKIAKLASKGIT